MRRTIRRSALLAALLGLAPGAAASSQSLYMPRSVKQAYKKGTRSADGRPGGRYWQNRARYTISVSAMPPDRAVRGTEQITYFNDSPDTLSRLVIKLFLNIHKPGAPRIGGASEAYLTSGTHVDAFTVNGQPTPWRDDPRYFTWQPVALSAPLLPHDSLRLSFDWHYDISRESNREGMIDSTTYFLAYFYPRVAVYDDTEGWDTMDFTDQQEFYSDFNDYDVTVRAPPNYVVWGTGTLLNPAEVLQPTALRRFQASLTADTVIHVATRTELAAGSITAQAPVNAWHFSARAIPDVAFAVANHYVWDATSVVVDDATRRRASAQAAYNDTASDYHRVAGYARHALDWLSHHWPGVPYPYEKTTVVQGFAGMEYPMMANDESYADTTFSRFVAEHEIAHTYFPFWMGTDETRYAFMDEGWATAFEYLIGQDDVGAEKAAAFFKQFRVNAWAADPSALEDLPIITPADVLKNNAYGNNAYGKPALGYLALKDMLGDAAFRRALHGYMERWHGRHPLPWDFFNSVDDISGRNLDWFWDAWYFSTGYVDLALADVRRDGTGYQLRIDNVGGLPAPFDVLVQYADGSTDTAHQTSAVWERNRKTTAVVVSARKPVRAITLDSGIWVDADTTNNRWSPR